MQQEVILVNEQDEPIGAMEKMEAHRKAILHRAFSVFIFNEKGEMLLQQRANHKYHSGGLWTNACCSHPKPGEDTKNGALRRLNEELGFTTELNKAFDFIYKSDVGDGLTEFELDHVFVGYYNGMLDPDKDEVSDYCFMGLDEIAAALKSTPKKFTTWFHIALPLINKWIEKRNTN